VAVGGFSTAAKGDRMSELSPTEQKITATALDHFYDRLAKNGFSITRRQDFKFYAKIRRAYGTDHLNQAFDPRYTCFGPDDFWLLAENKQGQAVATYCVRRFAVADFYELVDSLELWFSRRRRRRDPRFCPQRTIPSLGGELVHDGGLWLREDYRGRSRLAANMPRLARALAMSERAFDHDTAMILADPSDPAAARRIAGFMGEKVYGFGRVVPLVDGWFPPERRAAIVHLCHATRAQAIASLQGPLLDIETSGRHEFRQRPLVYQHDQPVYPPAVLRERQQQACV
jgi:hypothetical protein